MIDLWPKEIDFTQVKAPVTLLKEQAALLGQRTKNLLEAEVELYDGGFNYLITNLADKVFGKGKSQFFHYAFYFIAPTLNNYHYRLFVMSYDIRLYPLIIDIDDDIRLEIQNSTADVLVANSEQEFVELLRKIFNASKTKRIMQSILAQIQFEPA